MEMKMRARSRGQVLVLGCLALFIMALMLMASFGVSNAIHERIRIQSHADAQAFSLATVEARAMNVTAHFNRAIAATLVAQMSLHSWMAIASNDVAMLQAGAYIMFTIAGIETGYGCYPFNFSHCPCVAAALISAFRFLSAHSEWQNTLEGLESTFNDGVKALKEMVDSLHKAQKAVLDGAKVELNGGHVMDKLKQANAPKSEYITALNDMNVGDFACALEGSGFDDSCSGPHKRDKASVADRSKVMSDAANAARPMFDQMGMASAVMSDDNFKGFSDPKVPKDALTDGKWTHFFMTQGRVGSSNYDSQASAGSEAKNVGAGDVGSGVAVVTSFKHVPIMAMPFTGSVYSDSGGGQHDPMGDSHSNFKGVYSEDDPCNNSNCFVNFRATDDAKKDFGQPTVYGGAKQDLRIYQTKNGFGEKPPWELNDARKVKIEIVQGDAAEIDYLARNNGMGYAVSKAKVYFHQLGNWQSPPNLFDAFWRAKLHFFSKTELQSVLDVSGDPNGSKLLNAGAPVEGETK